MEGIEKVKPIKIKLADPMMLPLLIPALCGDLDEITITQALNQARQRDLKQWEQENIPYTMRKNRHAFFNESTSQKAGDFNSG